LLQSREIELLVGGYYALHYYAGVQRDTKDLDLMVRPSDIAGVLDLCRSAWYNRTGVERVTGFCTDDQYEEFFRSVPEFEKMLIRSGIQLIKYWFSITD